MIKNIKLQYALMVCCFLINVALYACFFCFAILSFLLFYKLRRMNTLLKANTLISLLWNDIDLNYLILKFFFWEINSVLIFVVNTWDTFSFAFTCDFFAFRFCLFIVFQHCYLLWQLHLSLCCCFFFCIFSLRDCNLQLLVVCRCWCCCCWLVVGGR